MDLMEQWGVTLDEVISTGMRGGFVSRVEWDNGHVDYLEGSVRQVTEDIADLLTWEKTNATFTVVPLAWHEILSLADSRAFGMI